MADTKDLKPRFPIMLKILALSWKVSTLFFDFYIFSLAHNILHVLTVSLYFIIIVKLLYNYCHLKPVIKLSLNPSFLTSD